MKELSFKSQDLATRSKNALAAKKAWALKVDAANKRIAALKRSTTTTMSIAADRADRVANKLSEAAAAAAKQRTMKAQTLALAIQNQIRLSKSSGEKNELRAKLTALKATEAGDTKKDKKERKKAQELAKKPKPSVKKKGRRRDEDRLVSLDDAEDMGSVQTLLGQPALQR